MIDKNKYLESIPESASGGDIYLHQEHCWGGRINNAALYWRGSGAGLQPSKRCFYIYTLIGQ